MDGTQRLNGADGADGADDAGEDEMDACVLFEHGWINPGPGSNISSAT